MYTSVASKLVVSSAAPAYSKAVPMASANQVLFDVTVEAVAGTFQSLTVTLQESNDRQNWSDVVSSAAIESVGYSTKQTASGVAGQVVRLKYSVSAADTGAAVITAGIDTADL